MNARTLTALLLKVWGITTIVNALISLGSYAVTLSFPSSGPQEGMYHTVLVSNAVGIILSAFAGVMLLRFASAISSRLFEPSTDAPLVLAPDALLRVFLVALGLYLVVEGLRSSAVIGFELATKPSWDQASAIDTVWNRQREALISAIVALLSGLALLGFRAQLSSALGVPIAPSLPESTSPTE
jgi:hypothetical protein